jgi:hypothetical protein
MKLESTFPVLWQGNREYIRRLKELDCPREIPWPLIEEYRDGCILNHDQTPEVLSIRGGLSPAEIVGLTQGLRGRDLLACMKMSVEQEVELLKAILHLHNTTVVSK